MAPLQVAIVGAGVIGLSTAVYIQEQISSAEVTIVADKFQDETLSIGAGGLFRPEINVGPTLDISKRWYKDTYDYFMRLATSEEAGKAGVQIVSGYHLSSVSEQACRNALLEEIVEDMRLVPTTEIHRLFDSKYQHGYFYTTLVVDPRYYLKWLQQKFVNSGGNFVKKNIQDLRTDAFLKEFDAIVNCTGFGAKSLEEDWKMMPIRGQTIKVKAPWIKHFFFADGVYVIPGCDGLVTLGGIKTYGDYNECVTKEDHEYIWRKCIELVPNLENAEICWSWCGLRPFRQPVRLEVEFIDRGTKRIPLIHNYGHGGNGVSLSHGTAAHAAQILIGHQNSMKQFSKL